MWMNESTQVGTTWSTGSAAVDAVAGGTGEMDEEDAWGTDGWRGGGGW